MTSSKTKFVDRALLLDSAGEGTGFAMKGYLIHSLPRPEELDLNIKPDSWKNMTDKMIGQVT